MVKKITKFIVIGLVLILIIFTCWVIRDKIKESSISSVHSANYSQALESIEKCNQDMIEGNKSDWCTGYHDTYRECTYGSGKLTYCISANGEIIKDYFKINKNETKEICNSYLHKGLGANCLKTLAENQEDINECLELASGDTYLIAICNLQPGEFLESSKNINEYL